MSQSKLEPCEAIVLMEDRPSIAAVELISEEEGIGLQIVHEERVFLDTIHGMSVDFTIIDLNHRELQEKKNLGPILVRSEQSPTLLVTSYVTLNKAIEAIGAGAYDYIVRPFQIEELRVIIRNARERSRLLKENRLLVNLLKGGSVPIREDQVKFLSKEGEEDPKEADIKQVLKLKREILCIYNKIGSYGSD